MANRIIIKPNTSETPSGMILGGSYQFAPGKIRLMVSEDAYIEADESDKNLPASLNITFSQRMPEYIISYDPDSNDAYDKRRKELVEVFFAEHPLMTRNGKPTKFTKSAMYDMHSEQEKSNDQYESWVENLKVMNRLNEMDELELRNAMYYYGVEPGRRSKSELIIKLGDVPNGLAIVDVDYATKKSNFISMFSNEKAEQEKQYIVNMRKALMNGIISNKMDGNRSNYYHGTTFVGTSFNDLIAYAKREDRIYKEHIMPRLEEMDYMFVKTEKSDELLGAAEAKASKKK